MTTRLKQLRREQGFSAKRLADCMGISEKAVILWQDGRHTPNWRNAKKLEAVLHTPLEILCAPENDNALDTNAEGARGTNDGSNGDHDRYVTG